MTLETAIQENTQALRDLITALGADAYRKAKAVDDEPDFSTPAGTEDKTLADPPKAAHTPNAPETPEEPAPAEDAPADVTLDDVRAAALALVKTNRDGLVDILSDMDVAKATELPEDKWAEFIDRVNGAAQGEAA
ncbi:hypothetical protein [Guyparkeria halopsychrophila]|uniref:hypothetical protein n=1 Tax=Guyparkeria halopsychrophila TaxID=3139421 RepID=UPI0037CA8694